MKEFVISEAKVETAILVGLITQTQDERKTTEYLDELEFLAQTAGAEVVRRFTQKLPSPHSVTYVGKGKLEEIRDYIRAEEEEEREIGMVIFDDELSAYYRHLDNVVILRDNFITARGEGRLDGLAEGLAEGRAVGLVEGRAEGRVEGREEERLDIARNMKAEGMSVPLIAKLTNREQSVIEKL